MKNLFLGAGFLLALGIFTAQESHAQVKQIVCNESFGWRCASNEGIRIKDVVLAGDGCLVDNAAVQFNEAGDQIEVSFAGYNAMAMPGQTVVKNCAVTLNLVVPNGVSTTLFLVDYSGFALLPKGATMDFMRNYRLQGERQPAQTAFARPYKLVGRSSWNSGTRSYEAEQIAWEMKPDQLTIGAFNYSTLCGADAFLTANSRMILTNRGDVDAYASVDRAGIRKQTVLHYGLTSSRCR
jgi:Domain of unknown function (DUF4360)